MFYHSNRKVNKTYCKTQNGERAISMFEELCPSSVSDVRVGDAAVQLDDINVIGFIDPHSGRGWLAETDPLKAR